MQRGAHKARVPHALRLSVCASPFGCCLIERQANVLQHFHISHTQFADIARCRRAAPGGGSERQECGRQCSTECGALSEGTDDRRPGRIGDRGSVPPGAGAASLMKTRTSRSTPRQQIRAGCRSSSYAGSSSRLSDARMTRMASAEIIASALSGGTSPNSGR